MVVRRASLRRKYEILFQVQTFPRPERRKKEKERKEERKKYSFK
jgi:hypothetical protein